MGEVTRLGIMHTGRCNSNGDLADWLHAYADIIRACDAPLDVVSLVIEGSDGRLSNYTCACKPQDMARVCGLLHIAAQYKCTDLLDDVLEQHGAPR